MRFRAEVDGESIPLEVTGAGGRCRVRIGDEVLDLDARSTAAGVWSLLVDGASLAAEVVEDEGAWVVTVGGEQFRIAVEEEVRYLLRTHGGMAHGGGQVVKAPMPGRVVVVQVAAGQTVQPGDSLLVLEAMKMENELRAAVGGTVREVRARAGQAVNAGDVMVVIE